MSYDLKRKVFIYSIPRDTATGISDWASDVTGRKLKKTKIGNATDSLSALYSNKTGRLATGLNKPWIVNGKQKENKDGKLLTLQDKYEQEFNLEPGYLTDRPWRKGDSLKEENLTYFQKKLWTLKDGATMLDLTNFDDLMGYHVMLESKYIANSEREWREHKWPYASHYIALENESEEIKYNRNQQKSKAMAALHDSKMTDQMKRKFVSILDLAPATSAVTPEQVHNLLFAYLDQSKFGPGSNLEKFQSAHTDLKTKDGRERIEALWTLLRAQDLRIIHEKQGAYVWPRSKGTIELGITKEKAVDFILDPKKQPLVDELEEQIEKKLNV